MPWLKFICGTLLAVYLGVLNLISRIGVVAVFTACLASSQEASADQSQEQESKRILGIIPNYRTSPSLVNYEPLSTGEKFKVASEDAFDRGTVVLAAMFGAQDQLTNSNKAFGQGAAVRVLRSLLWRSRHWGLHD